MKLTTFQTVAGRYSRAIGRNAKVRVTFGGQMAFVSNDPNGKRLNLPALPPGTVMTMHQANVFRGYLNHEVGHLRWTDLDFIQKQTEFLPTTETDQKKRIKLNKEYDPTLAWLWNVIEDVYEENRTVADLPGTRDFMDTTHRYMDGECRKKIAESEEPRTYEDLVLAAIYRECWKFRDVARDVGHDYTLDQLELDEVQELIDRKLTRCSNTKDCVALAREIKSYLEKVSDEFAKKPFDPGEKQGEDGDGNGEFSLGQGAPGSGDLDESAERMMGWIVDKVLDGLVRDLKKLNAREAGEKSDDGDDVSSSTLPGQHDGDDGGTCSSTPNIPPEVVLDPENIGGGHEPMEQWDQWLPPVTSEHDRIFVPSEENLDGFLRERAALSSHITAAKKSLNTYLRSRTMKAWSLGLSEGDVDDDALADFVAFGDDNCYKERRTRSLTAADLVLVVDLSSSMRADLVRQATITAAEALADIRQVRLMICGFYSGDRHLGDAPGCGRNVDLNIPLFKDFDEPYRRVCGRLGAIGTGGCTPLGEGYAYGYEALVTSTATRRVLWIVTDGAPYYSMCSDAYGSHSDYALMAHIHAKARRRGIETMALEIGCSNMGEYVDRSEMIQSINEMTQAIVKLTRSVLVPETA